MLKIIELLDNRKVPFDILYSNHSREFIKATEQPIPIFRSRMIMSDQLRSMHNMEEMLVKVAPLLPDLRTEMLYIANKSYKPHLNLLDGTLSEDGKNMTIYSHAGIGLEVIQALALKLSTPTNPIVYSEETPTKLAETIGKINAAFQIHLHNSTVKTLEENAIVEAVRDAKDVDFRSHPLEILMWGRKYTPAAIGRREKVFADGSMLSFVHGHDSGEKLRPANVICLDNFLGKISESDLKAITNLEDVKRCKEFHYLVSQEKSILRPVMKASVAIDAKVSQMGLMSQPTLHNTIEQEDQVQLLHKKSKDGPI